APTLFPYTTLFRPQVRRPARLIQMDDAPGLHRKVERVDDASRRRGNGLPGGGEPGVQQRIQRNQAESGRAPAKKRPAAHLAAEAAIHDAPQYLVISSCRFSTARVTAAVAASQAERRASRGRGATPVPTKPRAPTGSAAERFRLRW